jgi:hypothetical protein
VNPFAASLIRTIVPIAVGSVISWLALISLDIDAAGQAGLSTFLTAILTGGYYALVRLVETKVPQVGWLLGLAKSPDSYSVDTDPAKRRA